ncbi:MAG: pyridoxal-phosphate dependent enzyme [Candidatus Tectomicrobia bacterium]|uniref:Pyridoxal-phosphate dependent enzyme n=1 Tax=Tectimicrobiota bacterium TaxID=2528274 RepID=A0A937W150_UNCTE|nr:pyridoxal-phosphate dependent enzyme [Candidatus Tectomicrobia bacterium]
MSSPMLSSQERDTLLQQYPLLATIGHTPLVHVDVLAEECPDVMVSAKLEYFNPGGSLKDRPVRQILLDALASGALRPGKIILDSSSGNAGIAYAMLGAVLKYPVHLVIPENASLERRKRIVAHGAKLITTDALKGYDEALREVHRLAERESEQYFFADQYSNPSNWQAHYHGTAVEILEQTGGKLTHFVGGIGTGGAITGIGRRLKEYNPDIQVIAIIPEEFPGVEGLKPLGTPDAIVPAILDQSVIDMRVDVTVEAAYDMCWRLAGAGFFVGQSSGAYMQGVHTVAKTLQSGHIVTLFNDLGERYASTHLWER